jgi:hypothetical protein
MSRADQGIANSGRSDPVEDLRLRQPESEACAGAMNWTINSPHLLGAGEFIFHAMSYRTHPIHDSVEGTLPSKIFVWLPVGIS